MILRHVIAYNNQIITQIIDNDHIEGVLNDLKNQIAAQGGNIKALKVKTDIELEEGEYEIINLDENSVDKEN